MRSRVVAAAVAPAAGSAPFDGGAPLAALALEPSPPPQADAIDQESDRESGRTEIVRSTHGSSR